MIARYAIGIVLGLLLALLIAPLFPYPVDVIVMWLGYFGAAVCAILLVLGLMRGDRPHTRL